MAKFLTQIVRFHRKSFPSEQLVERGDGVVAIVCDSNTAGSSEPRFV